MSKSKIRLILEIGIAFFISILAKIVINYVENALRLDSLWFGVLTYVLATLPVLFYIVKIEQKPLSVIGLKAITLKDVLFGILLAIIIYIVQMAPMVAMGIDLRQMGGELPGLGTALTMSLYLLICVGFSEEVLLRGFILEKSNQLFGSKILAVALNCLLFYAYHFPPVRFVFGEFYSTSMTTVILCSFLYLYKSKKSIVPLIIAHGVFDILISYGINVWVLIFG